MDFNLIQEQIRQLIARFFDWISSPVFYSQVGLIVLAVVVAYALAVLIKRHSPSLNEAPRDSLPYIMRNGLYRFRGLLFPLFTILFLTIAIDLSDYLVKQSWLVRIAESTAVLLMIYSLLSGFVTNLFLKTLLKWIAIPIAILQIFGWLDNVTAYLESLFVEIGNIKISAYGVARVLIFGAVLFWLGRVSNNAGQKIIRQQQNLM